MKLDFYSQTHIGLVRSENQDSIMTDGVHNLFIVADGMGGHKGGKTASRLAIQTISSYLTKKLTEDSPCIALDIEKSYEEANRRIYNKGIQNPELRGMGTTVCLFLVREDGTAYIGNVGDSRLYMLKDGTLWQLTEDHTSITSQIKAGLLTGQKVPKSPFSEDHMLTKSVGFLSDIQADVFTKKVHSKEVYLLCSDGLTGAVSNEEIQNHLQSHQGKHRVQHCLNQALQKGGADNISVIVVEIL